VMGRAILARLKWA